MSASYDEFLRAKATSDPATGLVSMPPLNPMLFPFQADMVRWALRRGRAAVFADCGLGKTPMQLEWAKHVPGNALILAPLAVAAQTVREGEKFGIPVRYCRDQSEVEPGITIANYEMLQHFSPEQFAGVVLDESSILKSYDGKTRTQIIDTFKQTPFRLACTATPAPNDYMELGNHAEFLGVMTRAEMLAMFFVHDGGDTSQWRLKGHADAEFWKWLCSWAVMIRKPSDLGYDDGAFTLPEMVMHQIEVKVDCPSEGWLFPVEALTLQERLRARRDTIAERVEHCAALVNASDEQFLIWTNLNAEADAVEKAISGSVQVAGADTREFKEAAIRDFQSGKIRILISKVSIFGFGLNLQCCRNVAFLGLSDSFESYYQAVRRCFRFGQTQIVNVYVITAETEGAVVANIKRKEADAMKMAENMIRHMHDLNAAALHGASERVIDQYEPKHPMALPEWIAA